MIHKTKYINEYKSNNNNRIHHLYGRNARIAIYEILPSWYSKLLNLRGEFTANIIMYCRKKKIK